MKNMDEKEIWKMTMNEVFRCDGEYPMSDMNIVIQKCYQSLSEFPE